ncbi:hypothetical protein [Halolamina sp.]|jgi:hypothetical protein|uniref:hypothetical protein n=1 Tax=Halolamina sp. TaxID=1940283 RepID=UPI000223BA25|nr:hypothetical protein Halar_2920 [halophilic archaeon DL31]
MQRRAVAVFVAFFLVVGSLSLALVVTAESPHLDAEGRELQAGDSFTVSEQEYTVASITATESSGGEGGTTYETVFEWTVQNSDYSQSWENNSTVEFDGQTWRVLTGAGEDPTTFTLEQQIDKQAILAEDPDASNETVMYEGEEHVVITENGEERLVPADEYFPEPESREYSEGDTLDYNGNASSVDAVSATAVDLSWIAPQTMSSSVGQRANVTLSEQTFYVDFVDESTILLSSDFAALNELNTATDTQHTYENGLWGVTLLSGISAIFLLGMAYMPSRY